MQRDCTIVPRQLCRRDPVLHTKAFHVVNFCGCYCLILAEGQTRLSDFTFTFHFRALEKEMAAHSSVLAWRILGMGEPGGQPSMGLRIVGHDWSNSAAAAVSHVDFLFAWPCHVTYGILVPWSEIKYTPHALEAQSLNHQITRKVPLCYFWCDFF